MLTSSGYSAITSVAPSKVYRAKTERESRTKPVSGSIDRDSVTLSVPSGDSRFHMALVSRLAQEVRTATTTGDIAALRQQVADRGYTPDPMSIAAKILFLGGEG